MIVEGLAYARSTTSELRLYWSDADQIVRELLAHLRKVQSIEQLEMAGSYRRGKETVGDLDVLVVAADAKAVMDQFAAFPPVASTLVRGDTKMSVRLQGGFQIDLRVVPAESFGAALQYFTGSKEHNVIVRGRAKQMGLKVNEWGVFRVEGERETYVAGRNEQEVYEALGLPEFPPEMREARHEFAWAETGDLPVLITVDDIQGDLHMHTTATDGKNSIEEMAAAARARGLTYIAITDHSKRVSMANGLDGERLLAQWEEIDRVRQGLGKGITLLKGVECDILEKGGLDLPDEVLAQADWVMASIHYGQKQSQAQITGRILDAIAHPSVSAISHPTGRLINKREAYQVDIEAVMRQAAEHRKLLELNAHPTRLDLHDIHCAMAKEHGVPIVISTDAHSIEGLDVMKFGILQARRAGLTQDDVANTRTWPKVKQLLSRR
jgi:DNA polymerase (family 10)